MEDSWKTVYREGLAKKGGLDSLQFQEGAWQKKGGGSMVLTRASLGPVNGSFPIEFTEAFSQ